MQRPESSPPAPQFRLWIRRQAVAEGPYSVRFQAREGKGILRVSRPGVLVDPPARPEWTEERLSSAQLRSSRFLLVWDGGRARQAHLMTRLTETSLQALELGRWYEADVLVDAGFRHITVRPDAPPAELDDSVTDHERPPTAAFPFSPAALTEVATRSPFNSRPSLAVFEPEDTEEERQVSALRPRDLASPTLIPVGEVDDPTEESPPRRPTGFDDEAFFGDDDEAIFSIDTPSNRLETAHVMRGAVEAVTFVPDGADDEPIDAGEADEGLLVGDGGDELGEEEGLLAAHEADEELVAGDGEEMLAAVAAGELEAAEAEADGASAVQLVDGVEPETESNPIGARQSPIIRHLRRQLLDAQHQIQKLEARVQELEAALAARRRGG